MSAQQGSATDGEAAFSGSRSGDLALPRLMVTVHPDRPLPLAAETTGRRAISSDYVDVGPLEMYYERQGAGPPLVLLHGAFGTLESCFSRLRPALASHFEVFSQRVSGCRPWSAFR